MSSRGSLLAGGECSLLNFFIPVVYSDSGVMLRVFLREECTTRMVGGEVCSGTMTPGLSE